MNELRPSNRISNSRPVNQQTYSRRYNPVLGRKSVQEHKGPFKILARKFGVNSLLGYDAKEQSGFLAEKPVRKSEEVLKVISTFLKRYEGKSADDFNIITKNRNQFLTINHGEKTPKYTLTQKGTCFELSVKKDYRRKAEHQRNNYIPLRIHAKNIQEFKQKLAWILQNPVSRAKLDYRDPLVFGQTYIEFNENKVVGNFDIQKFKAIGNPSLAEGFDSELGSVDMHLINYHGPRVSYRGYSSLEKPSQPIKKVKDKFWSRVHGMNAHILSSNAVDELLGNIINMFYAGKGVSAANRAHLIRNIREDFIFNLSGKGSRNGRLNQNENDLFDSPSKFQNFLNQFHIAANPNRGGRLWRDIPPSLAQTIALMYHPTGDGEVKSLYDEDSQKYLKNMRNLKIQVSDKQFMAAYGRKILAIYIALKFIKHDLSELHINEKSTPKEIQKWRDLTQLHDELFESAGDLKDFLRHNSSGFAQVKHSIVQENFPKIKNSHGINTSRSATQKTYHNITEKTLYPLMLNYTQFDSFLGLHTREKGSTILYNTLKSQVFEREIPDIVAASATVMLLEGVDKISRRLKFIDEIVGQDADLKGVLTQLGNKIHQGDIEGSCALFARQTKRITNMLDYEALFPNKKFQDLQTEGFMWEKEVIQPIVPAYNTLNKNIFMGGFAPVYIIEKNGKILTSKLVEAIKTQARLIQDIRQEMQENEIKSPYQTQAMQKLSTYMNSAADMIARKFMSEHQEYFKTLNDKEKHQIYRDIFKETYALQELVGNVACVLATEKESAYGIKAALDKRQEKRNQRLAKMTGQHSHKTQTVERN